MRHFIYIYKGKVYQNEKNWTFEHTEQVLERLGASYWEIEIGELKYKKNESSLTIR